MLSSVLPAITRVHAAGVVADHAAERAAVVGGGIGSEGQVMLLGGIAQVVEDHAGLHPGQLADGIDFENIAPCTW